MTGTVGKSARGQIVDFDNLAIKQKLADAPKTIEVAEREKMIIARRKRNKVVVVKEKVEEGESDDKTVEK